MKTMFKISWSPRAVTLALMSVLVAQAQPPAPPSTPPPPPTPVLPMPAAPTQTVSSAPTLLPATIATNTVSTNATHTGDSGIQLNFRDAPLDQLLNMYGDLTGRTIIRAPQIAAVITLRSQSSLTPSEAIQALESALALNNITLVPMGPKFSKVTRSEIGRQEGLALQRSDTGKPASETDQMVSYIVTLKYMEIEEALPVLQNIVHAYGKVQPLERANSFMVTDTSANILRIQEILEFMDQPPAMRVETKFFKLENGSAIDVANQLNLLVEDAQAKTTRATSIAPGIPIPIPTPTATPRPATTGGLAETMLSEGGLIQGRVKILADERTNMLIIIARPSNFPFFEQIIKELDGEVDPETVVHVIQLSWANADEMAGMLNDLLGTSGGSYGTRGSTQGGTSTGSAFGGGTAPSTGSSSRLGSSSSRSSSSRSSASRKTNSRTTSASSSRNRSSSSASRRTGTSLSGLPAGFNPFGNNPVNTTVETRVLADLRTNSLLLMGTKEDIADIESVIEKLDVMLSQVLIEAVILEVDLDKNTEAGINWLQRSMIAYNQTAAGPSGSLQVKQPVAAFGGGWNSSDASGKMTDPAAINRNFAMPPGLNYFATISGLNLDAIIHMVSRSSNVRILSTPVIMATDNEEAEIKNTTQYPVITSTSVFDTGNGAVRSSYEYTDIGIDLLVRPHINPNRMVVMDITQTADTKSGEVTIDNNSVPIISKREIKGLITVDDRTTIVLGGLVETTESKKRDSIPFLGDIPLLGWLFRMDNNQNKRTELLVLITPYVLKSPEEARAETQRLHKNSEMQNVLIRGWSDSSLASPDPILEKLSKKKTLFGKTPKPATANAAPPVALPTNLPSATTH